MTLTSFSKIAILLLLPAFLIASAVDMLSYAWCSGDNGHAESEYVTAEGCCGSDFQNCHIGKHDIATIHQSTDEHCGSCLDFNAQQSEVVLLKRLKRIPSVSFGTITSNGFPTISAQNANLVAGNLASQPPPRISQTILDHRTVVLLN